MQKTIGIILHTTPFKDKDVIVKLYTQSLGLVSFIVSNVKSPKSKIKSSLLQPLSVLEITFSFVSSKSLQRLEEASLHQQNIAIQSSIEKTSLLYFMNEVLYKSIKEEEANPKLFEFIISKINELESANKFYFFTISFLLQLSYYLGFYPNNNYSINTVCFDMIEGSYSNSLPTHSFVIEKKYCENLVSFIDEDFDVEISPADRNVIVFKLIDYYQLHIANFGNIKSLKVFNEMWG